MNINTEVIRCYYSTTQNRKWRMTFLLQNYIGTWLHPKKWIIAFCSTSFRITKYYLCDCGAKTFSPTNSQIIRRADSHDSSLLISHPPPLKLLQVSLINSVLSFKVSITNSQTGRPGIQPTYSVPHRIYAGTIPGLNNPPLLCPR